MVANAVNLYDCSDLSAGVSKRLPLKGVAGCALCPAPGARPLLAAYVPEAKGSPGFIALYDCGALVAGGDAPPPLCRKSFYRVGGWGLGGWVGGVGGGGAAAGPGTAAAAVQPHCCDTGCSALYPCSPVLTAPVLPAPIPCCSCCYRQANAAQLMWNATGTAVLALTSADVDATNQVRMEAFSGGLPTVRNRIASCARGLGLCAHYICCQADAAAAAARI